MIKLSVPCVFNDELLNAYVKLNADYAGKDIKICEAYASFSEVTSAREPSRLPPVSKEQLFDYVRKLQGIGISFNYALNSTTITLRDIEESIGRFLQELWEAGVRILTIASPLVMEYVRRKLPRFTIVVSTIASIDSLNRIRQVKTFGADRITLDIRCNRDFKFLHLLKDLKGKLRDTSFEVLVNEFCGDCSMRNMHYNLQSLNAISYTHGDRFFANYPFNRCTQLFMIKPEDILKTYWILPDWMNYYHETCGIDWMKITGRTIKNLTWHNFVLEKYMEQEYEGNVLELGPLVIGSLRQEGKRPKVYLDAGMLKSKGYLNYFIEKQPDCRYMCGTTCSFCDELAKEVVKFASE